MSAYLALLVVLLGVAFALLGLIGDNGAYTPGQAVMISVLTIALYVFFLYRQMGPQRGDFQEVVDADFASDSVTAADEHQSQTSVLEVIATHRSEVVSRAVVLLLTVIPIVLVSHDMAAFLDEGLDRIGVPVALSGILIAVIVFLPETVTAVRAAYVGEIQRMGNLCHGALVSTVGLTIPAVLTIGLFNGQTVLLAESPANLVLLAITIVLSIATFFGGKVTALHGGAHLMVFVLYMLVVFS